jgi:DNA-binding LacI/PurR family transcriptional regulator
VRFDDIEESRYSTPALTTISPDRAAIAGEAVARLAAGLDSSDGWERKEVTIGYTFEVRASSGG